MGKFCHNCGAKLPEGAKFCIECGSPVQESKKNKENKEASKTQKAVKSKAKDKEETKVLSGFDEEVLKEHKKKQKRVAHPAELDLEDLFSNGNNRKKQKSKKNINNQDKMDTSLKNKPPVQNKDSFNKNIRQNETVDKTPKKDSEYKIKNQTEESVNSKKTIVETKTLSRQKDSVKAERNLVKENQTNNQVVSKKKPIETKPVRKNRVEKSSDKNPVNKKQDEVASKEKPKLKTQTEAKPKLEKKDARKIESKEVKKVKAVPQQARRGARRSQSQPVKIQVAKKDKQNEKKVAVKVKEDRKPSTTEIRRKGEVQSKNTQSSKIADSKKVDESPRKENAKPVARRSNQVRRSGSDPRRTAQQTKRIETKERRSQNQLAQTKDGRRGVTRTKKPVRTVTPKKTDSEIVKEMAQQSNQRQGKALYDQIAEQKDFFINRHGFPQVNAQKPEYDNYYESVLPDDFLDDDVSTVQWNLVFLGILFFILYIVAILVIVYVL